jgi:hypothetical protein
MKSAALLFLSIFLTGCVVVGATRVGDGPVREAVSPEKVTIYRTADQVPRKYEEVAMLSAKGDYAATSEEQMYAEMREKAGEMGANAIILDSVAEPTTGSKVANALLGTSANRQGKAVAVYVLPADAPAAPAQ